MHRISRHDNLILTPGEQRALEEAKQRDYVVYEGRLRRHGKLEQAYANWCDAQGQPFIEVEILKRGYADIYAYQHTDYPGCGFPVDIRAEIEGLGRRETAEIRGSWFCVSELDCRIYKVQANRVEAVAAALYQLIKTPECDSGISLK